MTQKETVTYYLKKQELDKALAFAKEIKHKKNKIAGLEIIVQDLLAANNLEQALETIRLMPDERKQAGILKDVLRKALKNQNLHLAYQIAQSIQIPRSQSTSLKLVADHYLQQGQVKKALAIASDIKTLKTQTSLLKGMSERLLESNLVEALLAVERIKDVPVKLKLIERLTSQIISQSSAQEALNTIEDFSDTLSKIWLWSMAVPALSKKQGRILLEDALKTTEGLQSHYEKTLATTQLAVCTGRFLGNNAKADKLLASALVVAKKVWKDIDKLRALEYLCYSCIKTNRWALALDILQKHIDRVDVVEFLQKLTQQLKAKGYTTEADKLKEETNAILNKVVRNQQVKKLIKVSNEKPSQSNHYYYYSYDDDNKFYTMTDNEDGTFTAEYGRIGEDYSDTYSYPIEDWAKKYKEKLRKGYKDVTYMYETKEGEEKKVKFAPIAQPGIAQLVQELQQYAQQSVTENYTVNAQNVTLTQLDEAQVLIDDISAFAKNLNSRKNPRAKIDKLLLQLFTIIPRKMDYVDSYLTKDLADDQDVRRRISEEQATLDVMRGEVLTLQNTNNDNKQRTLTNAMGIKIETAQLGDIMAIRQLMGNKYFEEYFQQAYKVTNLKNRQNFDSKVNDTPNRRTKLLWHGSRNENWWSILKTGLVLRPANAVITGKMFGYGLYFADKVEKAMGYSSLYGSFWTSGESNKAYLAIYEVHLGNCLRRKQHEYWMYELTGDSLKKRGNYDSFFARGGADLINNEYIVYNQAQSTIKYLVEIHS